MADALSHFLYPGQQIGSDTRMCERLIVSLFRMTHPYETQLPRLTAGVIYPAALAHHVFYRQSDLGKNVVCVFMTSISLKHWKECIIRFLRETEV
jgi:hypothetical protein